MEVLSAQTYGARLVVRLLMNPGEPEWVHRPGDQQRDLDGLPVFGDNGDPVLLRGSAVPPDETGRTCHNCRYNWTVKEVVLDGLEYVSMTADQIWELVLQMHEPDPVPQTIAGLSGRSN